MDDIYKIIICLTQRICWRTFVRLQQVCKRFRENVQEYFVSFIDSFVDCSFTTILLRGDMVLITSKTLMDDIRDQICDDWTLTTQVSMYMHRYIPLYIRLLFVGEWIIIIKFGFLSMKLQLKNGKWIWFPGNRYCSQHTILINFLRKCLPHIYNELTS